MSVFELESINALCAGFGLGVLVISLAISALSFYSMSKNL